MTVASCPALYTWYFSGTTQTLSKQPTHLNFECILPTQHLHTHLTYTDIHTYQLRFVTYQVKKSILILSRDSMPRNENWQHACSRHLTFALIEEVCRKWYHIKCKRNLRTLFLPCWWHAHLQACGVTNNEHYATRSRRRVTRDVCPPPTHSQLLNLQPNY